MSALDDLTTELVAALSRERDAKVEFRDAQHRVAFAHSQVAEAFEAWTAAKAAQDMAARVARAGHGAS